MLFIPKELFVGLQIRKIVGNIKSVDGGKNVALGFASYKNEKGVIQHSSLETWRDKDIPRMCYDNIPTSGMSVAGSVTRWASSNKFIRVEDPRGFQLEIAIENFIEIIRDCTLDKGVIQDEMVWGFDTSIKLIKVNSNNYNIGLENFNIKMSDNISIKDIKPGYIVRLNNGKVGKYLGAWHIIENNYYNNFINDILSHKLSTSTITKRCYLVETKDEIIYSSYLTIKKIEDRNEEPISSIKLYLFEKIKKTFKYCYLKYLSNKEFEKLRLSWNDSARKNVYKKNNLDEKGTHIINEKEIPYSWQSLIFISDKKLKKAELEELIKKDIKEFI